MHKSSMPRHTIPRVIPSGMLSAKLAQWSYGAIVLEVDSPIVGSDVLPTAARARRAIPSIAAESVIVRWQVCAKCLGDRY